MHLRPPSIDHGVQSFIWALVFFVFLWLGMLAVGVAQGTSFILAFLLGIFIFLAIRIFGEDELTKRQARGSRRRLP